jgi:hypothetical protein
MFMKPGKQFYAVSIPQADGTVKYYTHQLIVNKRDEDPPLYSKHIKSNLVARRFQKEFSVWKDWKEDTQ